MNTAVATKEPIHRLGDSGIFKDFKRGVDDLLERRQYFISQVLPKLKENQDYYVIKGKKSLAKGGAEKLANIYNLTATFRKDSDTMEAFGGIPGLIAFVCDLSRRGAILGQGRGCSTLEANNKDANKAIKMAQKSAYIDSVIRTTGLSDIFTQDDFGSPNLSEQVLPEEIQEVRPTLMITDRQKELLTSLIYQNVPDRNQADKWVSSLDELTRAEASDQISSFIGIK